MPIDSSLYKTSMYVKVYDIRTYTYNEEVCPRKGDFSHTLALQNSGVNLKYLDNWKPFNFCA